MTRQPATAARRHIVCILLLAAVLAGTRQASAAVEISGGLDAGNAWVGDHVSFWLRVRNDQKAAVTLRVQVVGNGITLVALCSPLQRTDGAPCSPPPASIAITAQSESLLSGRLSVVDSGDLRVALQTVDQAGRVIVVPLGSLSATNRAWSAVEWTKDILVSLTLPIVLAFLGYKYQRRLQREQDEHKEREQAQADKRAEIEKALEERATSVRLMLPVVHTYAIRYYVDLVGAYWMFVRHAEAYAAAVRAPPSPDADPEKTSAARDRMLNEVALKFIKMHLIHREFYEQVGGMYLATLIAEDILTAAFARLDHSVMPPGDSAKRAMTTLIDALKTPSRDDVTGQAVPPKEAPAAGPSRIHVLNQTKLDLFLAGSAQEVRAAHAAVKARLKLWLDGDGYEDGLKCAQLYGDVLNNEMNIALQQWYGEIPRLDVTRCRELCVDICEELDDALQERAFAYLGLARPAPGPGAAVS